MLKKSLLLVYNFYFCMYNKVYFNICYRFCIFILLCGFFWWYLVFLLKRDLFSLIMLDSFFIFVFLWKCFLNIFCIKEFQLIVVELYVMLINGVLKKRQFVQVVFDEEYVVWNGQCRVFKERVYFYGFLMVLVFFVVQYFFFSLVS